MKSTALTAILVLGAFATLSAKNLKCDADLSHGLCWYAPEVPEVTVALSDTAGGNISSLVTLRVRKDIDRENDYVAFTHPVAAGSSNGNVTWKLGNIPPGFYTCIVEDDGKEISRFNIGYEPENVVSLPDSKGDFNEFWEKALEELAQVPGDFQMTENKALSGKKRKAYDVEMKSLGGETIKARVFIPVGKGKYPAIIYYNGYGAQPWDVDPDANPEWIEMMTSVRGQFLSQPDNTYGDWIRYNLDKPAEYYYRGAFMDAVRAIDFMAQLPQADEELIFAEGGSQGGALTLAAASLDSRLRAIAPYIPFLSDYQDYFRIVDWPAYPVREEAAKCGLTERQMYDNLTYFDIKNHARRIKAPVLMGIGLQDPTCPPHTNMSSYNLLNVPKQLVIYPTCGHTVEYDDWTPRRTEFFQSFIKK